MSKISDRINLIHTHKLNGLMIKIFAVAFVLSVLQDVILYFFFNQIELSLLLTNAFFLLFLSLSSYILYKRRFNPKLLGIYNVIVCISYIGFTLTNYQFSPSMIMFIAFNIIVASIYLDLKGYVLVSVISLVEIVYFSYFPAYMPQGEFWVEVSNRMQIILFVSLFCYGVLRPSQFLFTQLLEQELHAMQMVHELRNPLTTVKGFLQLRVNEQSLNDSSFELVLEELDRANSIINDYLTLYKPLSKNFDNCDINKVISDVVELIGIQAHCQGIMIEKQLDLSIPGLSADTNQIKQVIVNLIKNSVQAIGQDGKILIQSYFDRGRDNIIVAIHDSGPGFPIEMLNKKFTPFFTTKQEGNGLGLSVCKKIIDNHGGTMEFGNKPCKGSCVSISLPIITANKTA